MDLAKEHGISSRWKHQRAMDHAATADSQARSGRHDSALTYRRWAMEAESDAAMYLWDQPECEPSRSVLFRSAATLAIECGLTRHAEQLACQGLAGNPPAEIAEELRDLLRGLLNGKPIAPPVAGEE